MVNLMNRLRSFTALVCVFLLLAPLVAAQQPSSASPDSGASQPNAMASSGGWALTRPYYAPYVGPVNLANTGRIEALLRAGKLYLSLQDTVALALENNLDIELQRYGPQLADAGILRAKAGGLLRGVPSQVQSGPSSAGTGVGAGGQRGDATGISQSAASAASAFSSSGTVITQTGSTIPNLDPVVTGILRWAHTTNPQTSTLVTGTNSFINNSQLVSFNYQQGFTTGTAVTFGFANQSVSSNSLRAEINPSGSGSFTLNITQNLLQGFGRAVNERNIKIARNNREISDLVFRAQVITTVSAIINLYWDLVSFNEDVKVKQQALTLNEKLLSDNKKQVEIGTLAPIEIVRAEAEVARAQQDLTVAETRVLLQETILKNALSRTGVASPSISEARIICTDRMSAPGTEAIQPLQDLVADALQSRPELVQGRIQLQNSHIGLKGSRSQLLPVLNGFVSLANNGLAGDPNVYPPPPDYTRALPDPFFVGGFGSVLRQMFARNFPDYAAGIQLNIPLRNRQARADMTTDQLQIRQQEIGLRRLENQIRVEVQNALIGVQQARVAYQAALKSRVLQEQTLDAEQKKLALGASTIFNVILVQRDLAQAQSSEVNTLSAYSKAKVELGRVTSQTLSANNIVIDEAVRGRVSRPPSPLPSSGPI